MKLSFRRILEILCPMLCALILGCGQVREIGPPFGLTIRNGSDKDMTSVTAEVNSAGHSLGIFDFGSIRSFMNSRNSSFRAVELPRSSSITLG